ncbi:hypothetical protein BDN72DRAFT_877278 [Pluteus cervinus]|uniref:Uncharacterized protein n=1 Tax=Pluteus cervinus TaxID=181527 RepID=A0ACD3AZH1_9AGAR|nr:hypothetical protein BDN72DRAFT_877278 [Pluteus cervinus]
MSQYSAPSTSTLKQPHDRFFLIDDFVVLEVDSVLFRLPAFILRNNSFKLKQLIEANQGTSGITRPIELKSISVIDFESFLLVLLPTHIGEYEISLPGEWASVLKIANTLDFPAIRKLAVAQLESGASPIDRIVLGRKYNFPKLVASGYVELCRREAPITLLEGHSLGMSDVIDISSIRHHLRSAGSDAEITKDSVLKICSEPGRQVLEHNAVADFVAETFSETGDPLPPALPDLYVPSMPSLRNFVHAPPFVPAAPAIEASGRETQPGSPSDLGTTPIIPPQTTQTTPLVDRRKVRSNKGLAKVAWNFKYGGRGDFQAHWKSSAPEYKQLWTVEWKNRAKKMDDKQLDAFIKTKRIQDMIP